jgi:hypothetical protein
MRESERRGKGAGVAVTKSCHGVRLERFQRGNVTTEDTERHRGSQRKAEKKEYGGNLRVARRKQQRCAEKGRGGDSSQRHPSSLLFSVAPL